MSARLSWHEEEAAARDVRFAGWASKKADAARAAVTKEQIIDAFLAIRENQPNLDPQEAHRQAEILATGWATCECSRVFQPGERKYTQCFHCNQHSSASGPLTCVICQRRHKASFGACFDCKTKGREDQARFIRMVVLVRDRFTCQMCGKDGRDVEVAYTDDEEANEGVALQVDHIDPEGSAWWWNVQTLCTPCDLIKGKQYGPLDELAKIELMLAYRTYLSKYLDANETLKLDAAWRETLGYDFTAPAPMPDKQHLIEGRRYGTCDEIEGLLTVLHAFDSPEVSHAWNQTGQSNVQST